MWNFFKKRGGEPSDEKAHPAKLPRPREIPEAVGRHLVVELHKNPDWVWELKSVERPREDGKSRFDIRIFDQVQAFGMDAKIKDYTSLDNYPELILFEGWHDRKTRTINMEEKGGPGHVPKAA